MPNCTHCGGDRHEKDLRNWCTVCGRISCAKCGSTCIIDGRRGERKAPSNACQVCGDHIELPMVSFQMRKSFTSRDKRNAELFKDCSTGCGTRISVDNKKGKCIACVNKETNQRKQTEVEKRLERIKARGERRQKRIRGDRKQKESI